MVAVKTVKEFAEQNEQELKSFMIYKTGIRDEEIIRDTLQDFYVKLIESRALDKFDPEQVTYGSLERCFNTYICNLFCWLLPTLAKKNFRARFKVISTVRGGYADSKSVPSYFNYASDVWNYTLTESGPSQNVGFCIDPHYAASHTTVDEEYAAHAIFDDFRQHVVDTEKPKKAKRILEVIDRRAEGCTSRDVASMLGLSNNMIKFIKNHAREKFYNWADKEGLMRVSGKKKRNGLTYTEVVEEIKDVQRLIERSNRGDMTLPAGFSYKEAVLRLQYLRNRQRQLSKKAKRDRAEETN
ncbi:MAG: hypothetical protein GF334_05135 [Candidatus Altiarchaeales archaeon]|nr:hypothetical protein [Candidatus Altiarchaeales archaeon]